MAPESTTPPRRLLLGVSLKMYFSPSQTKQYIQSLAPISILSSSLRYPVQSFLIPSFVSIPIASSLPPSISLGAQNCHHEVRGAYTGEVSPADLKELGVSIVELGHAERRKFFGETDESTAKKARAVRAQQMTPLVCVGELVRSDVDSAAQEVIAQMKGVLDATVADVADESAWKYEVVFAYEPVWAIGQAESAGGDYVCAVVRQLRAFLEKEGREQVRIIYGGSAAPGTWEGMKGTLDGLFLGRFAHDVENWGKILIEVGESNM